MAKLFKPITIQNVTLKNRIVLAPMCMYSSDEQNGNVAPFHHVHYTSRAIGQVGLIMIEATAIAAQGRISEEDLGIWSDHHIKGLRELVQSMKINGAKTGIQLAHAGRKAKVSGPIFAPSALSFSDEYKKPKEMTTADIEQTILQFQEAAVRAKKANFDVIEIHAAHGYLIHSFLSPLTNKRTDKYGGSTDNRYRFLSEIIKAIRSVWSGPLFVRISAHDYKEGGLTPEDYIEFTHWMKNETVDLIDVSSGGLVLTDIKTYPCYQVPFSETIKHQCDVKTGAVGLITNGLQAEEILQNKRADLIFIGRALLRNPYWPFEAAKQLQIKIDRPKQYERGWLF